jgi:hypothetical protein
MNLTNILSRRQRRRAAGKAGHWGTPALIVGGVALTYFFDPDEGKRRRHVARDRFLAFFRRGGRKAAQQATRAGAAGSGLAPRAAHSVRDEQPPGDDVTLARKVETVIFRDQDVPKGKINVNAEGGVVFLRGEARTPDQIKDLEAKTRGIPGVEEVENLLHLPGTPAPTRQ